MLQPFRSLGARATLQITGGGAGLLALRDRVELLRAGLGAGRLLIEGMSAHAVLLWSIRPATLPRIAVKVTQPSRDFAGPAPVAAWSPSESGSGPPPLAVSVDECLYIRRVDEKIPLRPLMDLWGLHSHNVNEAYSCRLGADYIGIKEPRGR